MMKEMLKEAEYQLLHYPKRTIVGRIKRIIKSGRQKSRACRPGELAQWSFGKRTGRLLYAAQKFRGSKGNSGLFETLL